jgi:hypothetical protein
VVIGGFASVLAVVTLAACGGGDDPDRPKAEVIRGTDTTDISVREDQPFIIVLESNPSTGFTWTEPDRGKFNEDDVVKFINVTTVAPEDDTPGALPGNGSATAGSTRARKRSRWCTPGRTSPTRRTTRPSPTT